MLSAALNRIFTMRIPNKIQKKKPQEIVTDQHGG